jgi:amidase
VRDTAVVLDAVRGPGVGDAVIAPPPSRPYADEVGADPGRLRVGLLDVHPAGGFVHDDCVAAARSAAQLLADLGHTVDTTWPDALADRELPAQFGALWATQMAMGVAQFAATVGRELSADEIEPANQGLVDMARQFSAVDLATAQAAMYAFRRRVQQWWADGWDLLLTPTVAEPPPLISEFEPDPADAFAQSDRAWRFVPFTPAFNMSGQPAISLPLHWNSDGLPVGVQLVAAYGREDVLVRVAAQLEAARPWADRHPDLG